MRSTKDRIFNIGLGFLLSGILYPLGENFIWGGVLICILIHVFGERKVPDTKTKSPVSGSLFLD
jgi:hypothetical protein